MYFRGTLAFILLFNVALCQIGGPEAKKVPCPRCNRVTGELELSKNVPENVHTGESDNTHCPRCKGAQKAVMAVEKPCGPRCMEAKKEAEKEDLLKTQESDNTHCPRCKGVKKVEEPCGPRCVEAKKLAKIQAQEAVKTQESDNTHCPRCKGVKNPVV